MRRILFRWHPFGIDPKVDHSKEPMTTVVFELADFEDGTRLTITESGLERIPRERREEAYRANAGRWEHQVRLVVKYVAAQLP